MARSGSYDFSLTRDGIIKAALRKLRVVAQGDNPTTTQFSEAAEALNAMVKNWQAEGIQLWTLSWATQTLTASSVVVGTDSNDYECIRAHTSATADKPITGANYTTYWKATGGTGSGGVWASSTSYTSVAENNLGTNVIDIERAFIRRSGQDTELHKLTFEEYLMISDKTTTGKPANFWFERQHTPVLRLWPYPENTTDVIHLYEVLKTQDFDSASDDPDFSSEWIRALIFNLAVELAPEYAISIQDKQWLERYAMQSKITAQFGTLEKGDVGFTPDIRTF